MHTFVIDTENGSLRESYVGVVDLGVLTEANTRIIADPRFRKGLDFLTDLREAEMAVGYKEMFRHVSELPDLGTRKQAFIASHDLTFGVLRMFQTLAEEEGFYEELRVFMKFEQACEWLRS